MPKNHVSLVDVCRWHAQIKGPSIAYQFSNGEKTVATLSFSDLDREASSIAAWLVDRCQREDRVLLLLESEFDFVRAFFACLYAGVIAVPLNLAVGARRVSKICAIAKNAGARLMLASAASRTSLEGETLGLECLDFNRVRDEARGMDSLAGIRLGERSPAFLQYTSGSTAAPKGVLVSHGNLLANQQMIKRGFSHGDGTVFVGWLPLFHDMGLVGNMLQPAYLGIPAILMPPSAFIRRPVRWLKLISEHRATTSGGPDFGYELCNRRIDDADLAGLDLSSWSVAFNGAEPVRAQTLVRFCERFSRVGFRREAFYPCYGLAEATLFVTGPEAGQLPIVREVASTALERGVVPAKGESDAPLARTRSLVSCGTPWNEGLVRIVNPETLSACRAEEVGEIWISGPHVSQGYWGDAAASELTFKAYTTSGEGPFLRTGDLGFLEGKQLYVTGRIKDVLIFSGRNHYPQDIEQTASGCHAAFAGRPAAAVLVSERGRDALALVQEVPKSLATQYTQVARETLRKELKDKIRDAVAREHGLAPLHVLLVAQGSLPMTTSGKIQRSLTQKLLLEKQLSEIWTQRVAAAP